MIFEEYNVNVIYNGEVVINSIVVGKKAALELFNARMSALMKTRSSNMPVIIKENFCDFRDGTQLEMVLVNIEENNN